MADAELTWTVEPKGSMSNNFCIYVGVRIHMPDVQDQQTCWIIGHEENFFLVPEAKLFLGEEEDGGRRADVVLSFPSLNFVPGRCAQLRNLIAWVLTIL